MSDDIQTVQTDYAEAMEMLWRQSQTIKRLHQENEKLREENDAWRMDGASCANNVKRLRAENEKLRAALAPFVDAGHFKVVTNVGTTEENNQISIRVKESDLRAAAAALKETGDE